MTAELTPHRSRPTKGPLIAVITAAALVAAAALAFQLTRTDHPVGSTKLGLFRPGSAGEAAGASADLAMRVAPVIWTGADRLPDLGTEAEATRLDALDGLEGRVAGWAETLGVAGEITSLPDSPGVPGWQVQADGQSLVVTGGPSPSFSYFRDAAGVVSPSSTGSGGGVDGVDPRMPQDVETPPPPDPVPPANLPTAAAARDIAQDLLNRLGVVDDTWTFTTADADAGVSSEICRPDGVCEETVEESFVTTRSVIATLNIDGVENSGISWYVTVGDGGVIQDVSGSPVTPVGIGFLPLRSTLRAFDELATGAGRITPMPAEDLAAQIAPAPLECGPAVDCVTEPPSDPVTVTVSDVTLVSGPWFGGNPEAPTQYIVPMYRFVGLDDDGNEHVAEVLALTDAVLAPFPSEPQPFPIPVPGPPDTTGPDPAVPVPPVGTAPTPIGEPGRVTPVS